MKKISLFDHRFNNGDTTVNVEIICSCGKTFNDEMDFFRHQRDWLNKQLKEHGIEVV